MERLHYLKSSLTDEAASLIKNISIAEENYERAWGRLTNHFVNKRRLLFSCLDNFFQLKGVPVGSSAALKSLRDGTVEAIEILQHPVKEMEDIFCYITVQRFDPTTRRDWELSLGHSSSLITWQQVDDFLKSRIQALEKSSTLDTQRSAKKPFAQLKNTHSLHFIV